MDAAEIIRRAKRYCDLVNYTYRRMFFVVLILFFLIWLFGFRMLSFDEYRPLAVPVDDCLQKNIYRLRGEIAELDTSIRHVPPLPDENPFLPYVGNGYIGQAIVEEATIHVKVKTGRVLSVPLPFRPVVRVSVTDENSRREAFATQFVQGVVQQISCIERGMGDSLVAISRFYAHRTHPSILEQDVALTNPSVTDAIVGFEQLGWTGEPPFKSDVRKIQSGDEDSSYVVGSGMVSSSKGLIAAAVVYKKVPNAIEIKAKSTINVRFITVVNYRYLSSKAEFENVEQALRNKSEQDLKQALAVSMHNFQSENEKAWRDLWTTGFYISPSRAPGALNGYAINATIYYVLSQVRAPLHEVGIPQQEIAEANKVLNFADGCYGGHHTLQAPNLWSDLKTEKEIVNVANLWLLTLQRLGCHNLLRAGASGVIQGMVLSFGGLKFGNYHLEFNTEPKDLHRDYLFRRIAYGNATHVNISVTVGVNNKASVYAALDRSDREYFACDAGCLDAPVQLGPNKRMFPVKLTDPITSILYITSDRSHIEELRLSIHVKEVLEAPAHHTHVLSMHKHGSGHGTMSTMFWISISLVIIVFHVFLFHLVYTEYFGSQEKIRSRVRWSFYFLGWPIPCRTLKRPNCWPWKPWNPIPILEPEIEEGYEYFEYYLPCEAENPEIEEQEAEVEQGQEALLEIEPDN